MADFTFATTPRIVCEFGGARKLGTHVRELGARRALVITDAGLVDAGLTQAPVGFMEEDGITAEVWSRVQADPPEAVVEDAVQAARDMGADIVIGFGGGSAMDTAKLAALLAPTDQALPEIYGIGIARGPRLPLIQVPTTAGTGSEVTPIAIVTTPSSEKKGVVSNALYPDLALLDAELTMGLPQAVTAMTGIDAMVHAIEAFTSKHKKNVLSDGLAIRALQLMLPAMSDAASGTPSREAREAMLQGSLLAGMAFANAPVAAVHALAYPLGGIFHVPHGHANALMLVEVLKYNRDDAMAQYAELARAVLPNAQGLGREAACDAFITHMEALVASMPFAKTLREVGVNQGDLDRMATDAIKIERLLINNPREVTLDAARAMYAAVL